MSLHELSVVNEQLTQRQGEILPIEDWEAIHKDDLAAVRAVEFIFPDVPSLRRAFQADRRNLAKDARAIQTTFENNPFNQIH